MIGQKSKQIGPNKILWNKNDFSQSWRKNNFLDRMQNFHRYNSKYASSVKNWWRLNGS